MPALSDPEVNAILLQMIVADALPLWSSGVLFAAAAAIVWRAGSPIAWYADAISERTGLHRAFLGALFLGGITSLPEGAVTVSAAALEDASLAVSNLFGGVAMQVAILAVIDGVARGRPLSSRVDEAAVMLYGVLQSFVLVVAIGAITIGDTAIFGVARVLHCWPQPHSPLSI